MRPRAALASDCKHTGEGVSSSPAQRGGVVRRPSALLCGRAGVAETGASSGRTSGISLASPPFPKRTFFRARKQGRNHWGETAGG